jgi:hypothetical protein
MRMGMGMGILIGVGVLLGGCGVPGEAGRLAREEVAALAPGPGGAEDEAEVRAALVEQADAWEELRGLVQKRVVGGVPVGEDFLALVEEVAALARRQKELIAAGLDDAAGDAAALEKMRAMWEEAARYLGK